MLSILSYLIKGGSPSRTVVNFNEGRNVYRWDFFTHTHSMSIFANLNTSPTNLLIFAYFLALGVFVTFGG